jgi:Tol biopolymer transport system component
MKEIKIILLIISVTFISCSKEDQVIAPDPFVEVDEASLITWDNISGKIVYRKNSTLFLADKTSQTVKNLGACYLNNLKWNKATNEITGILTEDTVYSLEAYDLNGNHYELDEPSSFNNWIYDWLPDGRLAHITKLGYVNIENSKLIDENFNAAGIACSPDGKKIAVSFYDGDFWQGIRSKLIEIDITTRIKSELDSGGVVYRDLVYSPDSKNVLYVYGGSMLFGGGGLWYGLGLSSWPDTVAYYWSWGRGENPDWSSDGQRVIWSQTYKSTTEIKIMNVNGDNVVVAIQEGFYPLWIE